MGWGGGWGCDAPGPPAFACQTAVPSALLTAVCLFPVAAVLQQGKLGAETAQCYPPRVLGVSVEAGCRGSSLPELSLLPSLYVCLSVCIPASLLVTPSSLITSADYFQVRPHSQFLCGYESRGRLSTQDKRPSQTRPPLPLLGLSLHIPWSEDPAWRVTRFLLLHLYPEAVVCFCFI